MLEEGKLRHQTRPDGGRKPRHQTRPDGGREPRHQTRTDGGRERAKLVHLGKGQFRNDTHKDLRNRKTSAVRRGENRMSTYYRCNGNVYHVLRVIMSSDSLYF